MNIDSHNWRKSTYSGGGANECVEVAPLPTATGVRDTKDRKRGHIAVPGRAWAAMLEELKHS